MDMQVAPRGEAFIKTAHPNPGAPLIVPPGKSEERREEKFPEDLFTPSSLRRGGT